VPTPGAILGSIVIVPVFKPEFGVKLVSTLVPTGGVAISVLTLGLAGNPVLLSVVGLVVVGPPFIGGTICPVLGSVIGLTVASEPLLGKTDVEGKPVVSTDGVAVLPILLPILELALPTVGVAVVVSIGITIGPVLGSVIGLTTASAPLVGKIAGLVVKPGRLGFESCLGLPPEPGKCGLVIGPLSTQ